MGSRTHVRSYGFNWDTSLPPGIKWLLIINTAVFLVQTTVALLTFNGGGLLIWWLGLRPRGVIPGLCVWQPFTYLFLHGGLWHLLLNMLVLWLFGTDIERMWGRRRFLSYYFLTGVGAGLVNILVKIAVYPATDQALQIPTIGASGAIYGVLMAAAILFPDRQIWLIPFPVMLTMRVYSLIMGGIAFFGTLGAAGDSVSHVTHLSGMIVGYLYLRRGSYLFRLRNQFSDWKQRRLKRKFEVYARDHRDEPPSKPDQWVH